jgi:outer membrane protein TolC
MSFAPRCFALVATLVLAGVVRAPAAHAAPPAAPVAAPPAAPGAAAPADAAPAPAAESRLEATLRARAGGLRADDVAARAERESPEVRAKRRAVEAARAKVDQAVVGFVPRVTVTGRYVHNSKITPPNLGPMFQPLLDALGVPVVPDINFPLVYDVYSLQGQVVVPLSDYILRTTQNHAAATRSQAAARFAEAAARRKVQRDARVAFYNWARARGGVVVTQQALETARQHEKDVRAALHVGAASRADLLRVESQVAQTELLVERSRNLTALAEEQLRVIMHDPAGVSYELGEDLTRDPPVGGPLVLAALYEEALAQRPELKALGQTAAAIRETQKLARANYYPRLDAFANLYEQNPNPRYFPQESKWHFTWDVGVQLSWTLNDTLTARAQVREAAARVAETESQRAGLGDAIRMEVTQAYNTLREAEVALATTRRQLQAADESYRVRRDLFRVGRATSAELTDAETDLVRASLDQLNARIDARIGRLALDHALGREARPALTTAGAPLRRADGLAAPAGPRARARARVATR